MVNPMKFTIVKPLLNHTKSPGVKSPFIDFIVVQSPFSYGFPMVSCFFWGFGLLQALRCLANDAGATPSHVEAPLPEAGEDLICAKDVAIKCHEQLVDVFIQIDWFCRADRCPILCFRTEIGIAQNCGNIGLPQMAEDLLLVGGLEHF